MRIAEAACIFLHCFFLLLCVDRAYQESEREKFAVLESRARSDKNVMMSRLLHATYVGVSESLSEAMVESPVGNPRPLPSLVPGMLMSRGLVTSSLFSSRAPQSTILLFVLRCLI